MYSTGNHIQYPVINHNGKDYEKEYIYIYIWIILLYSRNQDYYSSIKFLKTEKIESRFVDTGESKMCSVGWQGGDLGD